MKRLSILVLLAVLVTAACGGNPAGQAEAGIPTATLAPIVSLTPRFTATPVPSRTALPTFTFTPSNTPITPTPSDTPTPTATPPITGIVASLETVNVRSGPGVTFSAIIALVPGTGVQVLGQNEDGRWLNIQLEDGRQGWISASLLRLDPRPTPVATATASPDLTALALGTALPTAVIGGGTITPTPPRSVITPSPVGTAAEIEPTEGLSLPVIPAIDVTAIAQTAAALSGGTPVGPTPIAPIPSSTQRILTIGTPVATNTAAAPVNTPLSGTATFTPLPLGSVVPVVTSQSGVGSEGDTGTQQGVDVLAYCDNRIFGRPAPTGLRAGATIDVFWSWYVSETELMQQHLDNVVYTVTVNGVALQNWQSYGTTVRRQADGNYYKYWFVPFGPLAAGQYTISYQVTWNTQITDGYDFFGPGTNKISENGSCTFTVQ